MFVYLAVLTVLFFDFAWDNDEGETVMMCVLIAALWPVVVVVSMIGMVVNGVQAVTGHSRHRGGDRG